MLDSMVEAKNLASITGFVAVRLKWPVEVNSCHSPTPREYPPDEAAPLMETAVPASAAITRQ